eukprot:CAMPEP_0117672694 /NCGR_PEP_ID=MMETSP0804-20121206/14052_1 /TAXON_ID=1074897 /ORGANISM="Tetraselmis astigmatica, Strain CCMP880" /LENGTH=33 /DNA_ID= /DNA_START= /DNA_END= /DNA_ORIENTATION=
MTTDIKHSDAVQFWYYKVIIHSDLLLNFKVSAF